MNDTARPAHRFPRNLVSYCTAAACAGLLGMPQVQAQKPGAAGPESVQPKPVPRAAALDGPGGTEPARAEEGDSDPVRALNRVLENVERSPKVRRAEAQKQINRIKQSGQMGDLVDALLLLSWQGAESTVPDPQLEDVDLALRSQLLDQFQKDLRQIVASGDRVRQGAAATLVGELALRARNVPTSTGTRRNSLVLASLGELSREMAPLEKSPDPEVRRAFVRALGKMRTYPELTAADSQQVLKEVDRRISDELPKLREKFKDRTEERIKEYQEELKSRLSGEMRDKREETFRQGIQQLVGTLERVMTSQDVLPVRQSAAVSLGDLLRPTATTETTRQSASTRPGLEDIIEYGQVIVPVAARGLSLDAAVARPAGQAGLLVLNELLDEIRQRSSDEVMTRERAARIMVTRPLAVAVGRSLPALTAAVNGSDPESRRLAREMLQDVGEYRSLYRQAQARSRGPLAGDKAPEDPIAQGLRGAVDSLISGLADALPAERRFAVEALEQIGAPPGRRTGDTPPVLDPDLLTPVVQALTQAAGDPDRFVRWGAVRALGRIGPVGDVGTAPVAALARALFDPEYAVRLAAATALQRYGPAAAPAVEALGQAVGQPDVEPSMAALRAVISLGPAGKEAVGALGQALSSEDVRKRRLAVDALVRLGRDAAPAAEALQAALNDPDSEVRRMAADALLRSHPAAPAAPAGTVGK